MRCRDYGEGGGRGDEGELSVVSIACRDRKGYGEGEERCTVEGWTQIR